MSLMVTLAVFGAQLLLILPNRIAAGDHAEAAVAARIITPNHSPTGRTPTCGRVVAWAAALATTRRYDGTPAKCNSERVGTLIRQRHHSTPTVDRDPREVVDRRLALTLAVLLDALRHRRAGPQRHPRERTTR